MFVVSDQSTLLSSPLDALVLKAEEFLEDIRQTLLSAGSDDVQQNVRTEILGQLDSQVVRFVMNKQEGYDGSLQAC